MTGLIVWKVREETLADNSQEAKSVIKMPMKAIFEISIIQTGRPDAPYKSFGTVSFISSVEACRPQILILTLPYSC
jgi:hypothetical protein